MPVYIIRAEDSGLVKIGWSKDPTKRMGDLRSSSTTELIILRLIDGIMPLEGIFHRHFKELRVRGEWFKFHPDMLTITFDECAIAPKAPGPARQRNRMLGVPDAPEEEIEQEIINRWFPRPDPFEHIGVYNRAWKAAKHHKDLRNLIAERRAEEQTDRISQTRSRSMLDGFALSADSLVPQSNSLTFE